MLHSQDAYTVCCFYKACAHFLPYTRKQVFSLSWHSSNVCSCKHGSHFPHCSRKKALGDFLFQGLALLYTFLQYHNNIYASAMLGQSVPTLFRYDKIVKSRRMNTMYGSIRHIQLISDIFPTLIFQIAIFKKKSFLWIFHLLNRCIDF